MKVYCLIQEDRHYNAEVTVFADKDEAIGTAAARIERDVNRFREVDKKPLLDVIDIAQLGVMTIKQIRDRESSPPENDHFGLNEAMINGETPWVFYCHAYDDGPTFRVVETELVK